ncbi:MAG: mitochondrial carrier domain-containing protein, partial [Olpidium bornovanus]
ERDGADNVSEEKAQWKSCGRNYETVHYFLALFASFTTKSWGGPALLLIFRNAAFLADDFLRAKLTHCPLSGRHRRVRPPPTRRSPNPPPAWTELPITTEFCNARDHSLFTAACREPPGRQALAGGPAAAEPHSRNSQRVLSPFLSGPSGHYVLRRRHAALAWGAEVGREKLPVGRVRRHVSAGCIGRCRFCPFLLTVFAGSREFRTQVAAGHPLDLIKVAACSGRLFAPVRLQTSNEYKNTLDCFTKTFSREGVRGLYKGMATPLVGVTPIFAVCFWGYDMGQRLARLIWNKHPEEKLEMSQILFAGGFSAIPATAFMTPTERIKCLLQIQSDSKGPAKYKGPVDAARKIFAEGGIRSLYRGTSATLLRDIPGSMAYFGGYEFVKKALTPAGSKPEDLSALAVFVAGGMAGVFNWTVAIVGFALIIPPDVLKSRLQTAPEGTYKGLGDVFFKLIKNEGPQALFRGLGPAMIRAFPANAAWCVSRLFALLIFSRCVHPTYFFPTSFLGVEVSLKVMNTMF